MDAYGLFGFPVHHSWSPFIHGLFARQTGQELTYHLFESEPAQFRHDVLDFFFNQGGCGCNVTLPHKRAAAELVNELTARAQRADAVNTIVRREGKLVGDNTDGVGSLTDLRQNLGLRFQAPRILLLGAGGAARGVLAPLLQLHPAVLLIANRTPERAVELAREFADLGATHGASFDAAALQQPFDLIVNATSASLQGAMPPVPAQAIGAHDRRATTWRTASGETAFTRWARQSGAAVVAQGWGMLVEQAAVAFELWRGVRPVTRPVLNALQEHAAAMAAARTPA